MHASCCSLQMGKSNEDTTYYRVPVRSRLLFQTGNGLRLRHVYERTLMPTPGGLPKAGDKIVGPEGTVYNVIQRTSSSAPFSIWIERADGLRFSSKFQSSNLRENRRQYRMMCETGKLPDGWKFSIEITLRESETSRSSKGRPRPMRQIRVRDAHRWKDVESARYYGEEVEVSLQYNEAQCSTLVMSEDELMDFCIRGLTYLRDKKEGITP